MNKNHNRLGMYILFSCIALLVLQLILYSCEVSKGVGNTTSTPTIPSIKPAVSTTGIAINEDYPLNGALQIFLQMLQ